MSTAGKRLVSRANIQPQAESAAFSLPPILPVPRIPARKITGVSTHFRRRRRQSPALPRLPEPPGSSPAQRCGARPTPAPVRAQQKPKPRSRKHTAGGHSGMRHQEQPDLRPGQGLHAERDEQQNQCSAPEQHSGDKPPEPARTAAQAQGGKKAPCAQPGEQFVRLHPKAPRKHGACHASPERKTQHDVGPHWDRDPLPGSGGKKPAGARRPRSTPNTAARRAPQEHRAARPMRAGAQGSAAPQGKSRPSRPGSRAPKPTRCHRGVHARAAAPRSGTGTAVTAGTGGVAAPRSRAEDPQDT